MDVVIKAYTGMTCIVLLAFLGVGILLASIDAKNADSFAADCVTKIENSNYSNSVIEACKIDAVGLGYELTVNTYDDSMGNQVGDLSLKYTYSLPIFNILDERFVVAYMR